MANHRAVFWGHSHEHGDPVVKIADGNRVTLQICLIIGVKRAFQESEISFTAERVVALFSVKSIESVNKL